MFKLILLVGNWNGFEPNIMIKMFSILFNCKYCVDFVSLKDNSFNISFTLLEYIC